MALAGLRGSPARPAFAAEHSPTDTAAAVEWVKAQLKSGKVPDPKDSEIYWKSAGHVIRSELLAYLNARGLESNESYTSNLESRRVAYAIMGQALSETTDWKTWIDTWFAVIVKDLERGREWTAHPNLHQVQVYQPGQLENVVALKGEILDLAAKNPELSKALYPKVLMLLPRQGSLESAHRNDETSKILADLTLSFLERVPPNDPKELWTSAAAALSKWSHLESTLPTERILALLLKHPDVPLDHLSPLLQSLHRIKSTEIRRSYWKALVAVASKQGKLAQLHSWDMTGTQTPGYVGSNGYSYDDFMKWLEGQRDHIINDPHLPMFLADDQEKLKVGLKLFKYLRRNPELDVYKNEYTIRNLLNAVDHSSPIWDQALMQLLSDPNATPVELQRIMFYLSQLRSDFLPFQKKYVEYLSHKDAKVRSAAARALGQSKVVDPDLQGEIALAIGRIRAQSRFVFLTQDHQKRYYVTIQELIGSLTSTKKLDFHVESALVDALNDKHPEVVKAAARALDRIPIDEVHIAKIQKLSQSGSKTAKSEVMRLLKPGAAGEERATEFTLLSSLLSNDSKVRQSAYESLRVRDITEAGEYQLGEILYPSKKRSFFQKVPNAGARRFATELLSKTAPQSEYSRIKLAKAMGDEDAKVAEAAFNKLREARFGEEAAQDIESVILNHLKYAKHGAIRARAAEILGEKGSNAAYQEAIIEQLVRESDPDVIAQMGRGLVGLLKRSRIFHSSLPRFFKIQNMATIVLVDALKVIGSRDLKPGLPYQATLEAISPLLVHKNGDVQLAAAQAFGYFQEVHEDQDRLTELTEHFNQANCHRTRRTK